ncbi:tpr repeat-containing protein [Anaeramoeba ignava]|uniref:Tpr repeat-containing protein n=1 Tax=Anaeramoeba ignava TaxID=1746090 RepID=A0A9Q0LCH5_ANAIG|nr:tpr repeat-containing protein [Anaeramoeba ignava]
MQNKQIIENSIKLLFRLGKEKETKTKAISTLEKLQIQLSPIQNKQRKLFKINGEFLLELKHNPKSFESCLYLAKIYLFKTNYEEAEKNCQKAIQLKSNSISAHLLLSTTYLKMGGNEKLKKALETAEKAFGLSKSQSKLQLKRKCIFLIEEIYYQKKDSQNIQLWPSKQFDFKNPQDCFVYSLYSFKYKNYKEIGKRLKKVIDSTSEKDFSSTKEQNLFINRKNLAQIILIITHKINKKFEKAIEATNKIKSEEKYRTFINAQLGDIYFLKKDFENAKKYFLQALENLDDNSLKYCILFRLADISHQQKNKTETHNFLSQVKIEEISDYQLLFQFGMLYKEIDNRDQAISCFQKVIEKNNSFSHSYICLGNILEKEYKWKQNRKLVSLFLENAEVSDIDQNSCLQKIPYFGIHPSLFHNSIYQDPQTQQEFVIEKIQINRDPNFTKQYNDFIAKAKSLDGSKWNIHGLFLFNNYLTFVTQKLNNSQALTENMKITLKSIDLIKIAIDLATALNSLMFMKFPHGNLDTSDIFLLPEFKKDFSCFRLNFSKNLGLSKFRNQNDIKDSKNADLKWFQNVFITLSKKIKRKSKFIDEVISEFQKEDFEFSKLLSLLTEILLKENQVKISKFQKQNEKKK